MSMNFLLDGKMSRDGLECPARRLSVWDPCYATCSANAWTPAVHRFCFTKQRAYVRMFYVCHRYCRGNSLGARMVRRGFSKDLVQLVLELMPVPAGHHPNCSPFGGIGWGALNGNQDTFLSFPPRWRYHLLRLKKVPAPRQPPPPPSYPYPKTKSVRRVTARGQRVSRRQQTSPRTGCRWRRTAAR